MKNTMIAKAQKEQKANQLWIVASEYLKNVRPHRLQRVSNDSHVAVVQAKIEKFGQQKPVLLVKENGKLYTVDGGHTGKAVANLGLTVWCKIVVIPEGTTTLEFIVSLNRNQLNWNKKNYIHSQVVEGNKNYIALNSVLQNAKEVTKNNKALKIDEVVLCGLCANEGRVKASQMVNDGSFKFRKDKESVNVMINYIYDFQKIGVKNGIRQSDALIKVITRQQLVGYGAKEHKAFLSKLAASPSVIEIINLMSNDNDIANKLTQEFFTPKLKRAA
jgi:hypothetical protein